MASDVAGKINTAWPIETIPDDNYLFLRVHKADIDDEGEPFPRAFRNQPKGSPGMSTDWQKYSTSAETQRRGRKPPEEYAVVRLLTGETRAIPGQQVIHEPDTKTNNQAHTEVFGDKTTEVRERFMQIYQIEISLGTVP